MPSTLKIAVRYLESVFYCSAHSLVMISDLEQFFHSQETSLILFYSGTYMYQATPTVDRFKVKKRSVLMATLTIRISGRWMLVFTFGHHRSLYHRHAMRILTDNHAAAKPITSMMNFKPYWRFFCLWDRDDNDAFLCFIHLFVRFINVLVQSKNKTTLTNISILSFFLSFVPKRCLLKVQSACSMHVFW